MRNRILSLAILSVVAASANAQLFNSGAFTANDPKFNRPVSLTGLSGVGTAVNYQVREFYVTASSTYVAEMASVSFANGGVDTYLLIYANSFNASSPLTNLVALNDDFTGTFTVLPGPYGSAVGAAGTGSSATGANPASRLSTTLTAGVQYYAVLTTFDNAEVGPWYLGIGGGQGQVIAGPVPEPMTMTVLALGAVAALRRRNRKS